MSDVVTLNSETVYRGHFRIDRLIVRHRRFDGGWTEPVTREVFERGHAVGVLLYDPHLDKLVLIEQFRIGVYAAEGTRELPERFSPWLVEIVAGIIDDGESAEGVARREALEEAGCAVETLEHVCVMFATPGAATETVRIFAGKVDASGAGGVHGLAEEQEDIRVRVVTPEEAYDLLDSGGVLNATAVVALQWFRANHERLRAAWTTGTPLGAA